jgi:hypothetical protein
MDGTAELFLLRPDGFLRFGASHRSNGSHLNPVGCRNSELVRGLRGSVDAWVDPRPDDLASQHRDLMAQHQQLGVLGRRTPRQQHKPPQHLAAQQIEQSKGHAPIIATWQLLWRTRCSAPTTDLLAPAGVEAAPRGRRPRPAPCSGQPAYPRRPGRRREGRHPLGHGIDSSPESGYKRATSLRKHS